ncbi:hypothetical protein K1T71_003557 [Dendrolimus kikuchii]|uniref:Uncharacterized protein n=1 Tax=Dendrolimus kikuchii TaxID=765133 RepID=A0ACC1DC72_9NEOP|nr:hypothetical protein K1T71_003557 [Dendrolimus kikuchii]
MEFDLKIALSLLPVMTDEDSTTRQLIDGINYYSSVLGSQQSKTHLVNFVLKSRLSQIAKSKLDSKYESVDDLIRDMRSILLPKKSFVALQNKLQTTRQDHKSINDYGKELTEIFMDLTIAQADGNSENLKILQPLNEKQAIKRFADGLRNKRLSTIVAARNFTSLKDAVQAAVDEEIATPSTSGEILTLNSRKYKSFSGTHYKGTTRASPTVGQRQWRGRGTNNNYGRSSFHRGAMSYQGQGRATQNYGRGQLTSFRGQYYTSNNRNNKYRGNRGTYQNGNINILNDKSTDTNKFFRD